jgi:hypothetical protein
MIVGMVEIGRGDRRGGKCVEKEERSMKEDISRKNQYKG